MIEPVEAGEQSFVLITGALGGLGSALSHVCAQRGYNLYLTDRLPGGEAFAESIVAAYGVQARYLACELTSPPERSALLAALEAQNVRFCGLFNVAGRDFEGDFLSRTRSQMLHLVELMITANLDLTHAVLALRDPSRRFLLVNTGSLAAFFPMPFKATYSSSKRFLVNFTLALREEMRPFGSALIVCPAGLPTHTESLAKAAAHGLWGRMTMSDTDQVARRTLELAEQGRALYVPGLLNRVLAALGTALYSPGLARFLGKRWRARSEAIRASIIE